MEDGLPRAETVETGVSAVVLAGAVLEVVLLDELVASAVLVGLEDVVVPEVVVARKGDVVLGTEVAPDWFVLPIEVEGPPRTCCSHAARTAAAPKRMKRRRVIQVDVD